MTAFGAAGILKVIDPQDAATITCWALVFGFGQDVITRGLDTRLSATKAPAPT